MMKANIEIKAKWRVFVIILLNVLVLYLGFVLFEVFGLHFVCQIHSKVFS